MHFRCYTVPSLLLHDLRRTGARNLRREGVSESVAMEILGHKTSAIFRRYDITDEADLAEAAARLDAKASRRAVTENGYSIGYSDSKTVQLPKPTTLN